MEESNLEDNDGGDDEEVDWGLDNDEADDEKSMYIKQI